MKTLLIVWAGQSGRTRQLVDACVLGAQAEPAVQLRVLGALQAGPDDMLAADGLVLATPENFGYMAGALKDFFDRSFYPCEARVNGRPYALLVSAGNDGHGAVTAVTRIVCGWRLREVVPAQIVRGEPDAAALAQANETGQALAAGLALGLW